MQHAFDVPQLDAEDELGISHNEKARAKLLLKLPRAFGCIVLELQKSYSLDIPSVSELLQSHYITKSDAKFLRCAASSSC